MKILSCFTQLEPLLQKSLSRCFLNTVLGVGSTLLLLLLTSEPCLSADNPADNKEDARGEYQFSWLDPDKKIYVLQNRKYTKNDRILLSLMTGLGTSNPYRSSFNFDGRAAYYFSEFFGIEGFLGATANRTNNTFKAIEQASPSALPVVREVRSQYGGLLHWAPWYAKINMFNEILYFDWYFTLGLGMLNTRLNLNTRVGAPSSFVSESIFSVFMGTGHQYHLSRNVVVRIDFMGAFYRAPLFGNTGAQTWFSNYNFNFGIGYRI